MLCHIKNSGSSKPSCTWTKKSQWKKISWFHTACLKKCMHLHFLVFNFPYCPIMATISGLSRSVIMVLYWKVIIFAWILLVWVEACSFVSHYGHKASLSQRQWICSAAVWCWCAQIWNSMRKKYFRFEFDSCFLEIFCANIPIFML